MAEPTTGNNSAPLDDLELWEEDLRRRYPEPAETAATSLVNDSKKADEFRNYRAEARPCVKEFYRLNHTHQTYDFVQSRRGEYLQRNKGEMSVWEALELLNSLVDDSDPDIDLPQIEHCLQTAEAIRKDGHPRWFILTGLIHDLGKILTSFGEPQWAVVGDTFPVGCAFSERIVFAEFFDENPDREHSVYRTRLGIYEENCGLENVTMSWGHDEYLYHVVRDSLPEEALYMIRYHSFYPAHREGEYDYLMNDHDRAMFRWVRKFNPYDLYTKSPARPNVRELKPYYQELIHEFLPGKIRW